MPTLKASGVPIREDIVDTISMITPEKYPFKSQIGKAKATNPFHQTPTDQLRPANKDNAVLDGADAPDATLNPVKLVGNYLQTSVAVAPVSGRTRAMNTIGSKDEYERQIKKAMSELMRDTEASLCSNNGSNAEAGVTPSKSAGACAFVSTNVNGGTGSARPGYGVGPTVTAPTIGTNRALTKAMLDDMAHKVWLAGGDPTTILVPGTLKQKIAAFSTGNGAWNQDASKATIYAGVDVYVSDFGRHDIIPSHFMPANTVFFFDPSLWRLAYSRALEKIDIGKRGDSDIKQLLTEFTLEARNEAGNGIISEVQ